MNENIIQNVTYPSAYNTALATGSASMQGIKNLQTHNILSYPVEEITQKSNADGTNLRTIKAVLTTYKPTMPVRDSVYEMRSVAPVTGFVPSSPGTVNTASIKKDSHYQPVVSFDSYDGVGNILQEKKVGDALHSYIWGYQTYSSPAYNSYPIAEVVNAANSDIAYTNFESYGFTGYGNWTYNNTGASNDVTAPMGPGCYSLSGYTISNTGLNTALTYIVSFWAKTGAAVTVTGGTVTQNPTGITLNGWTYYEYQASATTSVSVAGTGFIDELRLYPSTAQMTTYTYQPLVGITSACSAKSQFSYYQYDNVGRLVSITDQYGNITKSYVYHYKGQ